MAVLPSEEWLMQQIDGEVVLFHRYTEEELLRFNPFDGDEAAKAQKKIYDLGELDAEDKAFAHFWSGYFYAHARR
jgi:hypothetical protein